MAFNPVELGDQDVSIIDGGGGIRPVLGLHWIPVLKHDCAFTPANFSQVSLNFIQNPNVTSSHLFRADILHDSKDGELTDTETSSERMEKLKEECELAGNEHTGFKLQRTLIRQLIPRNPQLDRPIAQTCRLLHSVDTNGVEHNITVLTPHVRTIESLPWYHPAVKSVAFWHSWKSLAEDSMHQETEPRGRQGVVSIHYQLFPSQETPLPPRLLRTARNLLSVFYKHGQGLLGGYVKKVHHDQIISQQRVQNTYADLKTKHAKRLCEAWVEQTEPSKHVFEDLGIAAFLIELWKDMYADPNSEERHNARSLPAFPGFADIGCGNGVLTEVLLLSGYKGEGHDARRRKTWSVLSPKAQPCLHETLFVPQPLFDMHPVTTSGQSLKSRARSIFSPPQSSLEPPAKPWHNGLFPKGTFIISNHADELTPWTPLLAYLTESPFLAIPCCSHNLSGDRFRAPSANNSHTADDQAPAYFAACKSKTKAKSVAITIPCMETDGDDGTSSNPAFANQYREYVSADPPASTGTAAVEGEDPLQSRGKASDGISTAANPETGDLKTLSPKARAKQPSAYASLCEWVTHLSREVGFEMEREMLRIPSTRNVGLIGRALESAYKSHGKDERRTRVLAIVTREGVDGKAFVRRCEGVLAKSGGKGHG